jgi:hypothetical protein
VRRYVSNKDNRHGTVICLAGGCLFDEYVETPIAEEKKKDYDDTFHDDEDGNNKEEIRQLALIMQ